ncbi:MAG TPA: nitroreductase family protein [Acidimicrobiia bacterium]|nr:nitroreductase family protein [Acidimicrobiia bacterium]
METWDAIRARRNVREFSDQPLAGDALDRILEAGRVTPSSRNWQPWNFVVVTDSGRLRQLAEVWRGAWHVAGAKAAVVIVAPQVESERERATLQFDLGQAVMSMMVAAADLGIGSGHASVHDLELAARLLDLPAGRFAAHIISLGYPAERPLRPRRKVNRRAFEEVVHRDRWGGA